MQCASRVAEMSGGGSRQIWVGLVLLAAIASRSSRAAAEDGDAESLDGGTPNISARRSGDEKKSEKFYDVGGYGNGFVDYGGGYGHHGDAGIVRTQGKAYVVFGVLNRYPSLDCS